MRIGHGYYVHKFAENRKLILGGTEIPYEFGLLGHSDADVLVHAVMDSLLGAAALGANIFPIPMKGTKAQTASLCSKRFAESLTKTATKSAILILR